jgi:outer membrane protein TolC
MNDFRKMKSTLQGLRPFLCGLLLAVAPVAHGNAAGSGQAQEPAPVLTLKQVVEMALETNRSLIGGQYGVDSRQLALDGARSEFEWKLIPGADASVDDDGRQIGAGVAIEKKFTPGLSAILNPRLTNTRYDSDDDGFDGEVNLMLTVPLLRGFGSEVNLNGVRTAEYSLRSARRSHDLARVNIVLATVRAVYDIVQQRELVALYQDQTDRFRRHAVMARSKERVGLASPIDTYRAEIRLKDAQDSLTRSREALRNAGDSLKLILASPLETTLRVAAPMDFKSIDITLDAAVHAAMQNRIELKQVADDIEEADRSSRVSENHLKPQLDLIASYRQTGHEESVDDDFELGEERWFVNLSSSTDWSRTAEKAAYRQSLLAIRMARLNRWAKVDSIKQEVRQTFDALQKTEERIRIRSTQIDQANGKLALANVKFSHAMADNFDVIEAETELQTATVNWLAAKIDHIVGRYQLRAAMGTLIQ